MLLNENICTMLFSRPFSHMVFLAQEATVGLGRAAEAEEGWMPSWSQVSRLVVLSLAVCSCRVGGSTGAVMKDASVV